MKDELEFYQRTQKGGLLPLSKASLSLKTLANEVLYYTFIDYFDMYMELASQCCINYDKTLDILYSNKHLHKPTASNL